MKTRRKLLRIIVEAICNVHWHGREIGRVMEALITYAWVGGADYLGFQPNTEYPLDTARKVARYKRAATRTVPTGLRMGFLPFMMLTEYTTRIELLRFKRDGGKDVKVYPYLRTTKSEHGVRAYSKVLPAVRWCAELGIKVHCHFEHPNMTFTNRDAEYACAAVCEMFLETGATVIWEHGTDGRLIPLWKEWAKTGRFFVTLTAHHLVWTEDDDHGDVRKICKPPLKTSYDRDALVALVNEDHDWVMLGADDAAHPTDRKHVHTGKCACGEFTSPFLAELCAHALSHLLETKAGIEIFIRFTSRNARKLHRLRKASRTITLLRKKQTIKHSYQVGPWIVEPPGAGEEISFSQVA